ncbi:MAG: hypothetical protein J5I62_12460, partial [Flavobacteriales bacterium]|nr:hypothetical protein [Flavobacteriales bacterium]
LLAGNYWLRDSVRGFVGWQYGLVWLNSDGSLDTTRIHRSIGGPFGALHLLKQLPDGKFLCGGGSGMFEDAPVSTIFRVNANGSLDTTFNALSTNWCEFDCFFPQPDGKVIVAGRWQFTDDQTHSLIRLLPSGAVDPSFNNSLNFESTYTTSPYEPRVMHVEPISDGMLAITGTFDRINGEVHRGIAMIDTAGNLLPGYFGGNGCGGFLEGAGTAVPTWYQFILGIKPAQDGGYFIYGAYRGYDDGTTNDASQRLLSKLYGLNVGIEEQATGQPAPLQIAPNPASGAVQLAVGMAPPVQAMLTIHDASGRMVLQEPWPAGGFTHTVQAGTLAPGAYVARLGTAAGPAQYTGRLVVVP